MSSPAASKPKKLGRLFFWKRRERRPPDNQSIPMLQPSSSTPSHQRTDNEERVATPSNTESLPVTNDNENVVPVSGPETSYRYTDSMERYELARKRMQTVLNQSGFFDHHNSMITDVLDRLTPPDLSTGTVEEGAMELRTKIKESLIHQEIPTTTLKWALNIVIKGFRAVSPVLKNFLIVAQQGQSVRPPFFHFINIANFCADPNFESIWTYMQWFIDVNWGK